MNATQRLFRLDGRVALVTGAAGYLGSAMARALADAGAHVVVSGRSAAARDALAETLRGNGGSASSLALDVGDAAQIDDAVAQLARDHGRLDVLVNNAYDGRTGTFAAATDDDFAQAYRLTVIAAARLMRAATPLLADGARRSGATAAVVNVATMYAQVSPDPRIYGDSGHDSPPWYGAAKAGLLQLTRYAAVHLATHAIRVNALVPGPFPHPGTPDDFLTRLRAKVPLDRLGTSDEMRGPLLFLASDASSFVTGTMLPVDGGWTAW